MKRWAVIFCGMCLRTASLLGAQPGEPDAAELIRRLASLEFETREQATEQLCERAGQCWEQLLLARQSSDPEVRGRVLRALAAPTRRAMQTLIKETGEELKKAEKAVQVKRFELRLEVQAAAVHLQRVLADAETVNAKLRDSEADERTELAAQADALRKQADEAQGNEEDAAAKLQAAEIRASMQLSRLATLLCQCKRVAGMQEILGRNPPAKFDPRSLPFEQRVSLPVTIEFTNTPLDKALAWIAELSGLTVELDGAPAVRPQITFRAADMAAGTAVNWVSRIADCTCRVDQENQKIIVTARENPAEP